MTIEVSTSGYPQGKAAGLTRQPVSSALGEACTIHCRVPKMQPACRHPGIDTEANHLDITSFTSVALLTGRPGGMKAGLSCEYYVKRFSPSPKSTENSVPNTYWTSDCNFWSAKQTSNLQVVLKSENDQHHGDGNVGCPSIDASRELVMIAKKFI
jgi:hypothetical protein